MNATTSVIIASNNAEAVIAECLRRLLRQDEQSKLEIIVADSSTDKTPQLIKAQFPTVRLLHFDHPKSLPTLRGSGIALATGQIIAILDAYSMVSQDWLKQLLRIHAQYDHPAIGGAVDLHQPDQKGMLEWAQYFNEYGMFMTPINEGITDILPGSNISYKREVLFDGDTPRFTEFWKTFVNGGLEQSGRRLWQTPSIRVALWKPVGFGSFLLTRFIHGRCYGGMRCADSNRTERFLRLLSTPFVPFVLQYRWGRCFWAKKRYRIRFVLSLPLQLMLFACWSAGEFTGYLAGPGASCRKLHY